MKKIAFFAALCALAVSMFAAMSEPELAKKMKSVGDHNGALRKALQAGSMPDVAAHAQGVHDALMGTDAFWAEHKSDEGVKWTKDGLVASAAVAAAAKAGNADEVKASMGKLGASCKGCHTKHREQVSEGKYKVKGI